MLERPFHLMYITAVQPDSLKSIIYPSATKGVTGSLGSQYPLTWREAQCGEFSQLLAFILL
jgi:hypothetical protein